MSNNKKNNEADEVRRDIDELLEKNQLLTEQLDLRKTNWLYSHHLIFSIIIGLLYSFVISLMSNGFLYLLFLFRNLEGILQTIQAGFFVFLLFFFPAVSIFILVFLMKTPKLSVNAVIIFLFAYSVFEIILLCNNPVIGWLLQSQLSEQVTLTAIALTFSQSMFASVFLMFVPEFANRCGYRLVLNGSPYSFIVTADSEKVSEQLTKLGEDFRVKQVKTKDPLHLTFIKITRKKKSILQFFLTPEDNNEKTKVSLVMHLITNDVPMRAGKFEVEKIGKPVMNWLAVTNNFVVQELFEKCMSDEINVKSKLSLKKRQLSLPSRTMFKDFLIEHWKDISLIATVLIAILAWIFPQ